MYFKRLECLALLGVTIIDYVIKKNKTITKTKKRLTKLKGESRDRTGRQGHIHTQIHHAPVTKGCYGGLVKCHADLL